MREKRFKPGDVVLLASYPHASDIGRKLEVKEYSVEYGTAGLIVTAGWPCWFLDENSLIPWTKEDEERLNDKKLQKTLSEEYRATHPPWKSPEDSLIETVLFLYGKDPKALAAQIVRLQTELDELRK